MGSCDVTTNLNVPHMSCGIYKGALGMDIRDPLIGKKKWII